MLSRRHVLAGASALVLAGLGRKASAAPSTLTVTMPMVAPEWALLQRELLKAKATTTMNSRHLTGHAIDFYAWMDIDRDGKVEFEEMSAYPLMKEIADAIKMAASELQIPIVWGGDWKKFKDYPHIELDRRKYP